MVQVPLYNMAGKKVGEQALDPQVFAVAVRSTLVHEALVAQTANARKVVAHTKTRGEVRGGGKKPWRQKGTGRARHGSTRSPIWVGGGVTFGPRSDRSYGLKVNRKVKQAAVRMALTNKVQHDKLVVLDALTATDFSTKTMAGMLKALPVGRSVLIALPTRDDKTVKSLANLPHVTSVHVKNVNLNELLEHDTLLTTADGISKITELFG